MIESCLEMLKAKALFVQGIPYWGGGPGKSQGDDGSSSGHLSAIDPTTGETAFAHLRKSVELDDHLPYDEPWGWMQPTRHALGALLLEQGRVEEAEAVYRADLGLDTTLSRACQHPDNVWSLHGLHECLRRLGKTNEANIIKLRLDLANARADVPIKASCFCRLTHES